MTTTVRDLLEIAQCLEHVRSRPPRPLPHLAARQRDGPSRRPEPLRRNDSRHEPPAQPQHDAPKPATRKARHDDQHPAPHRT